MHTLDLNMMQIVRDACVSFVDNSVDFDGDPTYDRGIGEGYPSSRFNPGSTLVQPQIDVCHSGACCSQNG